MSEYFPERKFSGGRVKVALYLSNYVIKPDLKNKQVFIHQNLRKKVDLANLKYDVDKLDIDKLKNVPTNLSKWKGGEDKLDFDKLVPVLLI